MDKRAVFALGIFTLVVVSPVRADGPQADAAKPDAETTAATGILSEAQITGTAASPALTGAIAAVSAGKPLTEDQQTALASLDANSFGRVMAAAVRSVGDNTPEEERIRQTITEGQGQGTRLLEQARTRQADLSRARTNELQALTNRDQAVTNRNQSLTNLAQAANNAGQRNAQPQQNQNQQNQNQQNQQNQQQQQPPQQQVATTATPGAGGEMSQQEEGGKNDGGALKTAALADPGKPATVEVGKLVKEPEEGAAIVVASYTPTQTPRFVNDGADGFGATRNLAAGIYKGKPAAASSGSATASSNQLVTTGLSNRQATAGQAFMPSIYNTSTAAGSSRAARFILDSSVDGIVGGARSFAEIYSADVREAAKNGGGRSPASTGVTVLESTSTATGGHKPR
jgi:hypothetical protein